MDTSPVAHMVTLELPRRWTLDFANLIPAQRRLINELLGEGVVTSYSVAADRTQVWMVVVVDDRPDAVEEVIDRFPIAPYIDYRYEPLLFTNDTSSVLTYSLN